MRSIEKAIELIKKWEGFRREAYQDPVGIWTIGYGTTVYVSGDKVRPGDSITQSNAEFQLKRHIEDKILPKLDVILRQSVNDNQRNALISFIYNVGMGAFRRSTMLKMINYGDFFGAAAQFDRWVYAGGKRLNGLVKRRKEERALFELSDIKVHSSTDEMNEYDSKPITCIDRIKGFFS